MTAAVDVPAASPPTAPASAPRLGSGVHMHPPTDSFVAHALWGAARAVIRLCQGWGLDGGAMLPLLDERRFPLSPNDLHENRPIEWIWKQTGRAPPERAMHEHLALINRRVMGGVSELVVTVLLVDNLARQRPTWLQPHGLRMLTLVTTILAHKIVRETDVRTCDYCGAMLDLWPELSVERVGRIEYKVMDVFGWHLPRGTVYQIYADAIFNCYNETAEVPTAAPSIFDDDDDDDE